MRAQPMCTLQAKLKEGTRGQKSGVVAALDEWGTEILGSQVPAKLLRTLLPSLTAHA